MRLAQPLFCAPFLSAFVLLGIALSPHTAHAAETADATTLSGRLSAGVLKGLRSSPDRFVAESAALIYACGGADGADAAAIGDSIALERAGLRAKEMRRLLAGDLDNDGAVTAAELETLASAQAAGARAALRMAAATADADADGTVSAAELRAGAQAVALKKLPDTEASARKALIAFDLDGNGRVKVAEVAEGTALVVATE